MLNCCSIHSARLTRVSAAKKCAVYRDCLIYNEKSLSLSLSVLYVCLHVPKGKNIVRMISANYPGSC